ncbi:tripartite tricarboxylate transporter substrate binding protein [Bordetella petrii]|nr:tripartite tricarboxylate transporter substrate binding protein [Bordetella petrii]
MKAFKMMAALVYTVGLCGAGAAAADYPDHAIRMVVPNPPGGTNDKLARVLAERLTKDLGFPVVVENRPGASTAIGAQAVANAAPDGYTVLFGTTTTFVLNPLTRTDLPYDPARDFKMISIVAETPPIILANKSSPYRTIADLVEYARANPGQLMYSSAGTGTSLHTNMESFAAGADISLKHVPYQGSAPAMLALLRGDVPVMSEVVSGAVSQIQSGQVRALVIGSKERLALLPDVPTVQESGFTGFNGTGWWALAAPKGIPAAVEEKLRAATNKVMQEQSFQAAFEPDGLVIGAPRDAAAVQAYMDSELKNWAAAAKLVDKSTQEQAR